MNKIGFVVSSSPSQITIEVDGLQTLETFKEQLQIGNFLKISDGNLNYAVATINNISGQNSESDGSVTWKFVIDATPIGSLRNDGGQLCFSRGSQVLPVPTEEVFVFDNDDLKSIFSHDSKFNFKLGHLSKNNAIDFKVDGDKFFGKHVAVVGSTGSGKSCAVSSILQCAVGIDSETNTNSLNQRNSHILIFDIHSEYKSAFTLGTEQKFNLNDLDVDNIAIPYWLMNSVELESLFIESNESNSHNQVSQFKHAVILNKKKHNPTVSKVTYDSPIYFDIKEVFNFIVNKNNLTCYDKDSKKYLAITSAQIEYDEQLLWERHDFLPSTANGKNKDLNEKVYKDGGFNGDFERFISRFETTLNDKRLNFILSPKKKDKSDYQTEDFGEIIKQFLGYIDRQNITIIDLSGIPFEVLSLTVSMVSRLIFDFAFHYSKLQHDAGANNDIPFLIVCEEAHNYIPRQGGSEFNASKRSLERIAKEGRKYGLSLMVVSQRPSEVSDTIFSQCNNFVSLRLTNKADQNYIKALLPDGSSSVIDMLPTLSQGEAFVVGDAVLIPSLIELPMPKPQPKSSSIDTYSEWTEAWKDVSFEDVVLRWKK
ncbi:ATP-binding protein [Enterovibrio norvegicus]|uniref:ATP-binding protein n=1 Tax=Enterovibrio norvegicus TaxID=188144 RepID=UPI000C84C039|nr:ATP-binding protein [Enterovibrio norvegicus]PMI32081.1 ATPase [Enterovibrio norvegicus]